jgi:hypothetical protein
VIAPPVIVDGARPSLGRVPALGEHGAAIRAEFAAATTSSPYEKTSAA